MIGHKMRLKTIVINICLDDDKRKKVCKTLFIYVKLSLVTYIGQREDLRCIFAIAYYSKSKYIKPFTSLGRLLSGYIVLTYQGFNISSVICSSSSM